MSQRYLVSVGMPIYNESEHIAKTIESVLNQSFKDFQLIISDNASNDDTRDICRNYANIDSRIRFIENSVNTGASENFKQVFEVSKSKYFVWISGHDLWHQNFLSTCLKELEDNPSIVLCYPTSIWIDENEQKIGPIGRGIDTRGLDPISRFQVMLWGMGYGSPIYGLLRSSILDRVSLGTKTVGPDHILLSELSLLGDIAYIDEPLQFVRKLDDFGSWESYVNKVFNRSLSEFSGTELFWNMTYEYLKIIYKHVDNNFIRNVLSTSIINCLFTKYQWILSSLSRSGNQNILARQRLDELIGRSSQLGREIEGLWQQYHLSASQDKKIVIIDAVFFQLYPTGIARLWKSLLEEWANTEFGNHLIVLDRVGTAPKIAGINYYQLPAYDYNNTEQDREMLQGVCNELGAEIFISSYYTTPVETPSVFMGYDMIPEVIGWDLNNSMWQEKQRSIREASAYLTISAHTAKDLVAIYQDVEPDAVTVAHCGVQAIFKEQSTEEVTDFCNRYGITKPYFILIGSSWETYKNRILFWQAFSKLTNAAEFDVISTGLSGANGEEIKSYAPNSNVHYLRLEDDELSAAYAGAIALVYPSKYEGFGLPIVEAMASGCPVITCPNASIPEVAGEAAIYVSDDDIDGMAAALCEVQKPQVRSALIAAGLEQVKQFSWTKMADTVQSVLIAQTLSHLQLGEDNLIMFPDWSQDEEELGEEIANVCYNLAQNVASEGSNFGTRPTLLIDTTNIEDLETANILISSIAMNLMMSTDVDITEYIEISLTDKLAPIQWRSLLPKLRGKIGLEREDIQAIELSGATSLNELDLAESPSLALV
jgi:glycosyltransferase involved in cell wall biosynthesis